MNTIVIFVFALLIAKIKMLQKTKKNTLYNNIKTL